MDRSIKPNMPLWFYQLQQDSKLAIKTRKDLEINLITKSFEDEAFRQDLVANPKAVVEKELGIKLPEGIEIQILEDTETTLYMVLPSNPYEGMSELEMETNLGLTLEHVAQWVYEQQGNALLEEHNAIKIISKTWKDNEFKQRLITNPKKVIAKEFGQEFAPNVEIKVFGEKINVVYIVLPQLKDDLSFLLNFSTPFSSIAEYTLLVGSGGGGKVGSCNPCNDSSLCFPQTNKSKKFQCVDNSTRTNLCR